MSLSTWFAKIKLRLTPRRVAVQYFQWVWDFPRTREPTPLSGLLKRMESDLLSRLPSLEARRYYRSAEKLVYFVLELHTLAVTQWFEVSALLQLNQIALASLTCFVSRASQKLGRSI